MILNWFHNRLHIIEQARAYVPIIPAKIAITSTEDHSITTINTDGIAILRYYFMFE